MRIAQAWRLLVVAAAFAACLSAKAEEVSLAILFTADIHGAIEAAGHPIEPEGGREPGGGLLRCATLIRALREQSPNSILIDLGDLLQGAPAAFLTRGKVAIEAAASLGYDAFVLGNHDLEWGAEQAAALYSTTTVPLLAANLLPPKNNVGPAPLSFIVREINGVKVAVVGLTTPWIPMWLPENLLAGMKFEQSVPALRRIMPEVRANKPDVIVLAAHQAHRPHGDDPANQLNAVARAFPDIDLILGAHSHQAVPSRRIHGVPYAQPGSHGAWVGKALVRLDADSRQTLDVATELLRVGPDVQPDPAMRALLEPVIRRTLDVLSAPVGTAGCEHRPDAWGAGSPAVSALICEALHQASGADVVLHGVLSEAVLPQGPLFFSQLWSIIPYENSIVLASVTPADLGLILKDAARLSGRQRRFAWGWNVSAAKGLSMPGERSGEKEKRLLLAVNSFDACSAGGRLPRLREVLQKPESETRWTGVSARQALENYVKSNSQFCVRIGR